MKDGNRISPGQIMEGDEIRASYSGTGDVVEVGVLEIVSGGAPRAAAPYGSSAPSPPPR